MERESVAAFESVTPAPVGDIQIRDCYDAWDDKFAVIGGLDPTFLIRCTMEELEQRTVGDDREPGDHKTIVLANGDGPPPACLIRRNSTK